MTYAGQESATAALSQGSKPVIMAIDDEPVILNSLATILRADYSIRPFTSGKTALEYLVNGAADLILLDYQMPDMTGIDVIKALHEVLGTREIPVIFVSSSSDSQSEVEALELGAADYITKPIRPRRLLTRVRLQLELYRYRKHLETLVAERTRSLNAAYDKLKMREDATLSMLAKATDLRDHDTGGHIERTTEFVRIIIQDILEHPYPGYVLTRDVADDIIRSSKLHDLGKIAMPDVVLLKPGRLTEDEFIIVKKHPENGEHFLGDFVRRMADSFLDTARDIAYAHHERWDGRGYPLGLKGEDIPLPARVVALADVYDALTSVRPYKKSFTHEESLKIILEGSGTQFDPHLVEIFARHAGEFRDIAQRVGEGRG